MYQWIVLVHIVGAFIFVLSHGVAVCMAFELPKQRDSRRIMALLDLSSVSLGGLYLGLVLLLDRRDLGGIAGGHFSRLLDLGGARSCSSRSSSRCTRSRRRISSAFGWRSGNGSWGWPRTRPSRCPLGRGEIVAIAAKSARRSRSPRSGSAGS